MAYQVLARKWRPQDFHSMVGQEHVLRALIHALDAQRLHHAYLFAGTRGVGKTTIARILARCLNCEQGVNSTPCGTCSSCVEISEGRFVDLIEVDAASRTKVEDTRELLENVQYAPTRGRYKVYLIDEVHMLSTSSFNALLKTLEEPPPHVKFILATTDPQKLPVTVLSRCLQFNLKNMPVEQIAEYLSHVLGQEQLSFDEGSVWQIGRAAKGSMRDALSLTDQAISFCGGSLNEAAVTQMLGGIDQSRVVGIVEALRDNSAKDALRCVAELADQGQSFSAALEDVLALLHQIAISQVVEDAPIAVQFDRATVTRLKDQISGADVQLFFQMGVQALGDMPKHPDIRSALEMALLRMLAFRPQMSAHQMQAPAIAIAQQANVMAAAPVVQTDHESLSDTQSAPVLPSVKEALVDEAPSTKVDDPTPSVVEQGATTADGYHREGVSEGAATPMDVAASDGAPNAQDRMTQAHLSTVADSEEIITDTANAFSNAYTDVDAGLDTQERENAEAIVGAVVAEGAIAVAAPIARTVEANALAAPEQSHEHGHANRDDEQPDVPPWEELPSGATRVKTESDHVKEVIDQAPSVADVTPSQTLKDTVALEAPAPIPTEVVIERKITTSDNTATNSTAANDTSPATADLLGDGALDMTLGAAVRDEGEVIDLDIDLAPAPETPQHTWTLADLDSQNWPKIFADLAIEGLTKSLAANMVFAKRVGTTLNFTLQESQSDAFGVVHQGRIRQALESLFGCNLQLAIDIGVATEETPFAIDERRAEERQAQAVAAIKEDPYVRQIQETFNASVDENSIKPLDKG